MIICLVFFGLGFTLAILLYCVMYIVPSKNYRDIYVLVQYRDYRKENWIKVIGIYDERELALEHIPDDYKLITWDKQTWEKSEDEDDNGRILLRIYCAQDIVRKSNIAVCLLRTEWDCQEWQSDSTSVEVFPCLQRIDNPSLDFFVPNEEHNYEKRKVRTMIVMRELNKSVRLRTKC
jgi:hypothetical protein